VLSYPELNHVWPDDLSDDRGLIKMACFDEGKAEFTDTLYVVTSLEAKWHLRKYFYCFCDAT